MISCGCMLYAFIMTVELMANVHMPMLMVETAVDMVANVYVHMAVAELAEDLVVELAMLTWHMHMG